MTRSDIAFGRRCRELGKLWSALLNAQAELSAARRRCAAALKPQARGRNTRASAPAATSGRTTSPRSGDVPEAEDVPF